MRKGPLSSCFDCILLREPSPGQWWCGGYNKPLSYDIARTPNNCPRKKQNEEDIVVQFPREQILERLMRSCHELAEQLGRPFTIRELFEYVEYMNKNSLWELVEILVRAGRLEKANATMRTWARATYKVKTYFPTDWNGNATSTL